MGLRRLLLCAIALAWTMPASAEEIVLPEDWLNNPITDESIFSSSKQPYLGATRGLTTEVISVTPLDGVKLDAVGVIPARIAGLPGDFWGDSSTAALTRLLRGHHSDTLPEVTSLIHRILMTELPVPVGHDNDGEMLLARIDHLLAAGALEQAEALLDIAGIPSSAMFRRWFDVGLLTGRAHEACAAMLGDPGLAPALQARIFCLARSGDWNAAALTLTSARSLGQISAEQEHLLGRFLDPEIYEGEPDPPAPKRLTPLVFVMREALALPREGQALPLAFLHNDLRNYQGWRNKLVASERLVRSQALRPQALLDTYSEASASASGGIWDRVRSVRALMGALAAKDTARVNETLPVAYKHMADARLEYVLAELLEPRMLNMALTGKASEIRFKLALLHRDRADYAPRFAGPSEKDQILVALATGKMSGLVASSEMQQAITSAVFGDRLSHSLLAEVDAGRKGEAVLKALTLLQDTRLSDPGALETALSVLTRAGLEEEARIIAIQLLVLNHQAVI